MATQTYWSTKATSNTCTRTNSPPGNTQSRRQLLVTLAAAGAGSRLRASGAVQTKAATVELAPKPIQAAPKPVARLPPAPWRDIRLKPVSVGPERVIRNLVGLRP